MLKKHRHKKKINKESEITLPKTVTSTEKNRKNKLEIVLKCNSFGSVEAVNSLLSTIDREQIEIDIIHASVGPISKSDMLMSLDGSKLVVGFNVDVLPRLEHLIHEKGIEVRLYSVIYKLAEDLQKIAKSLVHHEPKEKITGQGKVIALFKSSRKGIILGCEVTQGMLTLGKRFRVISAMGLVYTGKIESLHIEDKAVNKAMVGHKVGLKISDFKDVKKDDIVECYEEIRQNIPWKPKGEIYRIES